MPEHKNAPAHTFCKDGIYYFRRRVPCDLSHHYTSQQIAFSLRTKVASVAGTRAIRAAMRLDEHWYHLRVQQQELPGKHLLRMQRTEHANPNPISRGEQTASVTLSEAVAIYLRLKGANRPVTFHRAAERSCGYVIDECGDKTLLEYSKADATSFRDALISRGLAGSSITRVFGTVRSVINFAASETGVTLSNPFTGVYYDRQSGVIDRSPLPTEVIRAVQRNSMALDDDLRWLVALIADTGLRLAEAAGLLREDLVLDAEVPHLVVREHPWRRLKTSSSAREIPLVGSALWAARRIHASANDSKFAFPRYNKEGQTKANAASAALNKWLKPLVPERCTMHSFRHSMRDRLRAVECPSDVVDQIGGWQTEGVGHSYGNGYPLAVLMKWMKAVE